MKIENHKTIKDLQKEFSTKFPYLKIEFYKKAHPDHKGSPKKFLFSPDKLIKEIRSIHNETDLTIMENMSASQLEQEFKDTYGLNVQVFRKSGGIWLQTISTDDWTLAEMNKKGKISAEGYKNDHE